MAPRLIVLAGLPGVGKSALAAALSRHSGARVFDKDRYRARLFGEKDRAEPEQNARAMRALFEDLARHLADPRESAILDGRTFTQSAHVEELVEFAREIGVRPAWVRVFADPLVARARLEADAAAGRHPAPDRDAALHARVASREEPLTVSHIAIDGASGTPDVLAQRVLEALAGSSDAAG